MVFAILPLLGLLALGAAQLFGSGWQPGVDTIRATFNDSLFWNALLVGLLAQIVDGALGMAYGLTSTSFYWLLEPRQPWPPPQCIWRKFLPPGVGNFPREIRQCG